MSCIYLIKQTTDSNNILLEITEHPLSELLPPSQGAERPEKLQLYATPVVRFEM